MVDARLLEDRQNSLLVALRVRHRDGDRCAELLQKLNEVLVQTEGFKSLDVIRREGGLGTDFYVVVRFRDSAALDAWRNSPKRAAALVDIEALAITDVSRQQAAGANIWFEPVGSLPSTPRPPLFWKRWAVSLLAVYPALIVLVTVLSPLTSRVPQALGLLIVAVILTGLTTAFIVPWLTRALNGWLTAR
ncbi:MULTISPECIES: antibiotic biosynthesis monooxygenase [unclassified Maritimibacter]|jgi:antibiotic biosynthesis monooxygenase (ABM) superfamily enzyme|uniref:antibiotic biosynthesis monooxygenase n=1 Tax=unclassified Maritimibacter TaxID=2635563 RepID=UPI000C0A6DC3|nr:MULTISPECIES: antibiotic biosynthesis monooxygenase [unclassified Maritimibacter]MAM61375.1 hypothetical protein [Maritimibacter sp.]MBL6430271.1 antibiotic biosynthesis monooxygenase [Maritimibacter sp.]|tara:strand:+ start:362 stop:931 length:570 start_codon:yes stop_codon:yes gene_type:complete